MTNQYLHLDDVTDMIDDIASDLGVDLDGETELHAWILNERITRHANPDAAILPEIPVTHAAQAIADIIAANITQGDEELVDAAMWDMMTTKGWRFGAHNIVLWTAYNGSTANNVSWADRLTVWLGNERDYDMTRLGTAEIKS
jgi:hypothetical protein